MRRAAIAMVTLALGAAGLLAACSSAIPLVPPLSDPAPMPSIRDEGSVRVFFLSKDGDAYDKSMFVGAERQVRDDAGIEEWLRIALQELVKGPTKEERNEGLASMFSAETVGLVKKVVVDDGRARVDFTDFRTIIPQAGTSSGGFDFQVSLNLTLFQFAEIEQVRYSIEGDCQRYWEVLQAEVCQPPITREAWDKAWNSLD